MNERKIVNYSVCCDNSLKVLTEEVLELIIDGWKPLGGISVTNDDDMYLFAQAMVEYEDI